MPKSALTAVVALAMSGCVGQDYRLRRILEVNGRQGVAVDEEHYYISGSKSLYKYRKDGILLRSEPDPFQAYPTPANHIGDIDAHEGEIYLGVEWFEDGVGKDIQITVHDADTLAFKRRFPFEPSSGQLEVSGIAVDREHRTLWMCSWVGGESGRHLYEYELDTGKYLRKVAMHPAPPWIQGVFYHEGSLYVSADDGDAEKEENDHIYRVRLDPGSLGKVTLEKTLTEVKRAGEIEGLAHDRFTGEWIIHHNRGKRIIRGMPKGLYPGYEREISEIYIFSCGDASRPARDCALPDDRMESRGAETRVTTGHMAAAR
jgi:hypothetical protein